MILLNKNGRETFMRKGTTLHISILLLLILVSITAGTIFLRYNRFYSSLSPGQDFPILRDIEGKTFSLDGKCIVVIGKDGCRFCFKQVALLDSLITTEPTFHEWKVILIAYKDDRAVVNSYQHFSSIKQIFFIDNDAFKKFGKLPYPTLFICKSGRKVASVTMGLIKYADLKFKLAHAQ